jgi:hypothetical protein
LTKGEVVLIFLVNFSIQKVCPVDNKIDSRKGGGLYDEDYTVAGQGLG